MLNYNSSCQIMRCRPFTFTHKVVNKWYHGKTVLIGDAAHIYPPFGGQGIVSGLRDAHQLAWRIALFERLSAPTSERIRRVLGDWATERTLSVQSSAALTELNGALCNQDQVCLSETIRMFEGGQRPSSRTETVDPHTAAEQEGLSDIAGFFSKAYGGGKRLPQIYVETLFGRKVLSDCIFGSQDSPLRLLVFVTSTKTPGLGLQSLQTMLAKSNISPVVLAPNSIAVLSREPCRPESVGIFSNNLIIISPTPLEQLSNKQARPGYNVAAFQERLGVSARYVIIRPDFFTFASAKDEKELELCLGELSSMLT